LKNRNQTNSKGMDENIFLKDMVKNRLENSYKSLAQL